VVGDYLIKLLLIGDSEMFNTAVLAFQYVRGFQEIATPKLRVAGQTNPVDKSIKHEAETKSNAYGIICILGESALVVPIIVLPRFLARKAANQGEGRKIDGLLSILVKAVVKEEVGGSGPQEKDQGTPSSLPIVTDDERGKTIAKEETPSKPTKRQLFPEMSTDTKRQSTSTGKTGTAGTQLAEKGTQAQSTKRQQFQNPSTELKKQKAISRLWTKDQRVQYDGRHGDDEKSITVEKREVSETKWLCPPSRALIFGKVDDSRAILSTRDELVVVGESLIEEVVRRLLYFRLIVTGSEESRSRWTEGALRVGIRCVSGWVVVNRRLVSCFRIFACSFAIMVEGEKPPKDKGVASGSNGGVIDQFDPLYLHSNDTNGIPLIGFKLEGTENYKIWRAAITIAIHTKNKLDFINGKVSRPEEEEFMQEQWDRCNSVVLNWILGCVSQDVFIGQVFSKDAKTVWDELEETYKYHHKFNALWRQYDSLVNLPDCICENSDKLKKHNQLLKLMQFLMGLDEVYAPIKSIILTTDPIPDVKGAFATLSTDESHRGTQSHSSSKMGNARKLNRPNLVCTHCNMNGHTADRCFELIGYPPNFKKNTGPNKGSASNNVASRNKDQSHTFTDDQYKRLMSLISEKSGSSSIPANIVGINRVISFCSSRLFNHNSNINSYKIYIGWIIDSGASQHMTYTVINMFNIVDVSKLNMTVGHPNGTTALVTYVGSLKLTNKIVIHNVLMVPGYQVSLLSVHSLSKDNKFRVIFDEDTCVIQDSVLRTQVGTGNESNGLYFLNTGKKLVNNNIQVCCLSKCIWHNRLGHPSDQVLDILRHKLNFETNTKIDLCEVCHKAKQTREPFPISEHKTKSLGDLVHLDVWGPYKVQSREGYKYFLTIVDDYTSSENKDYELELIDLNSLNFFNNDLGEDLSSTENTGNANKDDEGHPNDNIPEEATCEDLESAILEDNSLSEGDDTDYQEFNNQFQSQSPILNPDRQNESLRRQVNYSKLSIENYNFSTSLNKISEPKTYSEAAKDIRWIEAMNQEMEALNRNGTWIIVDLPIGRKPIGGKWVYKVKYQSSGEVDRFKARYVAKGYNQKEGIDYEETFSPVVKIVTVRCLLTLAVHNSWPIFQLDINNAFLYGELAEDVYMTLPEGYFDKDDKRVCKLVKSLYGLKQAPRKWNEKLVSVLLENDFLQSKNDFSLFTKNKNGIFIALLVYVDDIVITGNNNEEIKRVKEFLSSKFQIKDLGNLKYFLGIEVLESKGNLYLTQRKYCLEVLAEFGMLACRPCGTPIETKKSTTKDKKVVVDNLLSGVNNYQKLVGKLIYLTHTSLDISYDVHVLSQYMHAPLESHLRLAFRVLRYLKNASGKGISFVRSKDLSLSVYVDSNWANKKQSMLAKSSAEAEYRAMNTVTCESSAIQIAANPVFYEKTKHFEIELFFLRASLWENVKLYNLALGLEVKSLEVDGLKEL
ncbi:ribonuclease H-like domain-containing protein, partial [Tanacetum coccineum]